jgi:hypothetical protein
LNFDLQVAGCARPRHIKIAGVSSSYGGAIQSACGSSAVAVPTTATVCNPRVHSRPVPAAIATSGSADLVGATFGAATRDSRQLMAWSPSRQSFAVLQYGRADVDPANNRMHATDGHHILWQQVQQATKSRSFEDILMLSKDGTGGGVGGSGSGVDLSATGSGWSTGHGRQSDADHDDDDQTADDRSVPSSLSGHGGSLHGSLEMIQVS